jgi:putative PIN family toxin of toxin-antitoxin system
LRVVLDTNALVSGLAYPGSVPGRIVAAWRQGLDVVLSHYMLDEMVRVLRRLSRVRMTPVKIRDLADSSMFLADIVDPEAMQDEALHDPADQPVLMTLVARTPKYLITGNEDLLAFPDRYSIITPTEFWARHGRK